MEGAKPNIAPPERNASDCWGRPRFVSSLLHKLYVFIWSVDLWPDFWILVRRKLFKAVENRTSDQIAFYEVVSQSFRKTV